MSTCTDILRELESKLERDISTASSDTFDFADGLQTGKRIEAASILGWVRTALRQVEGN